MNKDLLRYLCISQGKTYETLAKSLGINLSTLYRKLSGESDFTRNEIQIVRSELGLSIEDVDRIFFAA